MQQAIEVLLIAVDLGQILALLVTPFTRQQFISRGRWGHSRNCLGLEQELLRWWAWVCLLESERHDFVVDGLSLRLAEPGVRPPHMQPPDLAGNGTVGDTSGDQESPAGLFGDVPSK